MIDLRSDTPPLNFLQINLVKIHLTTYEVTKFESNIPSSAIHYWWMNKEAYWETFLKLRPTARYWEVITIPDYNKAREGIYIDMKPE